MIFTARQLEQLHKNNGHVTLPYRARLTPLAQDWIRQRGVTIGYSDLQIENDRAPANAPATTKIAPPGIHQWMWWADGPCGPAKAALLNVAHETGLHTMEIAVDFSRVAEAVKIIAKEVKDGRAEGGVMLVNNGAAAMVYANRCPSIRAVLATSIDAVEQGAKLVAANVLVIEHPHKSLQQTKTLLSRFFKTKRELSDEVKRQLAELASCV